MIDLCCFTFYISNYWPYSRPTVITDFAASLTEFNKSWLMRKKVKVIELYLYRFEDLKKKTFDVRRNISEQNYFLDTLKLLVNS